MAPQAFIRIVVSAFALTAVSCTCVDTRQVATYACSTSGECSEAGATCCAGWCVQGPCVTDASVSVNAADGSTSTDAGENDDDAGADAGNVGVDASVELDAGSSDAGGPHDGGLGCESPEAPECGPWGSCVADGGVKCVCLAGYTGPTCRECATGYQDNDGNGSCARSCALAGITCDARSACSDSSGDARCECFSGYVGSPSGCMWAGVVRDPGFTGTPAGVWLMAGSYRLDTSNPGNANPGVVQAPAAADEGTLFTQANVNMPPAMGPDVFAVTLAVGSDGGTSSSHLPLLHNGLVRVGRSVAPWSWQFLPAPFPLPTWRTLSMCLGEGAFDSTIKTVTVVPAGVTAPFRSAVMIDSLDIAPSSECPAVGVTTNGDFESATVGWTMSTSATVVPSGTVNGSKAMRLAPPTDCESATGSTLVSVPLHNTLPNAAFRFSMVGNAAGLPLTVSMWGVPVTSFTAGTTVSTASVCVADWARGSTVRIELALPSASNVCTASTRRIDVDNAELYSDSRCATSFNPWNPGFESGGLQNHWYATTQSAASATIADGGAHGGARYASVHADGVCESATLAQLVMVPTPTSSAGPALHFWYRGTGSPAAQVAPLGAIGSSAVTLTLGDSATWARQTLCIDGARGGYPALLRWGVTNSTSGVCGSAGAPAWLDLDDVSVDTDRACPP